MASNGSLAFQMTLKQSIDEQNDTNMIQKDPNNTMEHRTIFKHKVLDGYLRTLLNEIGMIKR